MRAAHTTLFVYGTLMAEEVLSPLIGRLPAWRAGTIHGFSRGCVRGEAFPAVLRSGADDQVEGLLIEDLLPRELRALDYYVSDRHSNLREPSACRSGSVIKISRVRIMWTPSTRRDRCRLTLSGRAPARRRSRQAHQRIILSGGRGLRARRSPSRHC